MGRQTRRDSTGKAFFKPADPDCGSCRNCDRLASCMGRWAEALAAYEDTGLEPAGIDEALNEAHDLGYQACLNYKGSTWSEAAELQAYRAKIPVDRLDEAAALLKARDEGLVVVLPCKVGDGIYSLSWNVKTEQYDVRSGEVKNVRYDSAGDTVTVSDGEYFRVLGKTVFLTRAEAEEALAHKKENRPG